ncbi:pentatricopeptide repeat-containing protein At5g27460 isoform X1 [Telopea speciosissima]|uniref:pentatricopeptide repeat-containing protein At5g27460 isoform X1 n=1 Tax=Telopea speciosissima TaxID=54955 RepID=UPI001CC7CF5A|nr:pentatricopeptide repeat-containing protein At5g27460 isoform X1 [Telopea speciosissima]
MALRSLFGSLRRKCSQNPPFRPLYLEEKGLWRSLSSGALTSEEFEESPSPTGDLKSWIFKLRFPKRSATAAIQKWIGEGNKVTLSELRQISKDLRKSQRYKHALEILTWMEAQKSFRMQMSATEYAIRLELTIKVYGLSEAEEYFKNIPNRTAQRAACLPILHSYVKERATDKAEALMLKIHDLGLTVSPQPYTEMMKLYMATCQFEKVANVIQQMKQNRIPLNILSYNLWMNSCSEMSGVASAEMVFKEMMNDKNVKVGWSTYSTLANIYIKFGLVDNAILALRTAEQKLSTCNRLGYFFLITLYAALNNKEGVLRLWEASKAVGGKMTCANYMCIILCLVKVNDIQEAERVFRSWESECGKYDIRVSNVLLGAYMRKGWMEKAESLHQHTLEKGGSPNYKTWEILMEGWVKNQQMDQAITAMKKGFAMLKHCHWRPSPAIIMSIADYFEEHGNLEDAKRYVKVLQKLGLVTLPLYKSLLRVHIRTGKPAPKILVMMEKNKIETDGEASELIRCVNKIPIED